MDADVPGGVNMSLFVGNDRQPSQKYGMRQENRNAPDLSQTIEDIYYLEFSLVRKIRNGQETVKSQTV